MAHGGSLRTCGAVLAVLVSSLSCCKPEWNNCSRLREPNGVFCCRGELAELGMSHPLPQLSQSK